MNKTNICVMSTLLDGGTGRHYKEMANCYSYRCLVILAEYLRHAIVVSFIVEGKVAKQKLFCGRKMVSNFVKELKKYNIEIIHLHHFLYMAEDLRRFLLSQDYKLEITLHDYCVICPRINMTFKGKYCHEASIEDCNKCISQSDCDGFEPFRLQMRYMSDIQEWRTYFLDFLNRAEYVFVPSYDQRDRLLRYFPKLKKIRVVENPEVINPVVCKITRIGILGAISQVKGRKVLLECARLAEKKRLPLKFILFGTLEPMEENLPKNL